MSIVISVASDPSDARAMQEVYYKAWLETYPNRGAGITREDIVESWKEAFTEERLKKAEQRIVNQDNNETLIFAKDGSRLVGVARIVRHEEKNELQSIYVLPEYHGQGIGTKLWESLRKYSTPSQKTTVSVATYNLKAINFYKKLGFIDTGRRFTEERFRFKSGSIIPEMEMVL